MNKNKILNYCHVNFFQWRKAFNNFTLNKIHTVNVSKAHTMEKDFYIIYKNEILHTRAKNKSKIILVKKLISFIFTGKTENKKIKKLSKKEAVQCFLSLPDFRKK